MSDQRHAGIGQSWNCARAGLCLALAGWAASGAPVRAGVVAFDPEIELVGNGVDIASGDDTPSPLDHTDFGTLASGEAPLSRTFTIRNVGVDPLTLATLPADRVVVTGSAAFSVTLQPASPVSGLDETTFTLTYTPTVLAPDVAVIRIANDDPDDGEQPFEFHVAGGGLNTAPTVTSDGGGPNALVYRPENTTEVTVVEAIDPDAPGQTLSFALSGPDAAHFSLDSQSGVLAFLSPPDFEMPADAGLDGIYDVVVQVSDGHEPPGLDEQVLAIQVYNGNDAPSFTAGSDITLTCADPGNQSLPGWATDLEDGDPSVSQELSFTVTATGDAIFSFGPELDQFGTLHYGLNGTCGQASITITLEDDTSILANPFAGPMPEPLPGTPARTSTPVTVQFRVQDTTPPSFVFVYPDAVLPCGSIPVFNTPHALDECSGLAPPLSYVDTVASVYGSCDPDSVHTRTWFAFDACGNQSSVSQTFTIHDTTGDDCFALADGGLVGDAQNGAAQDLLGRIEKANGNSTSIGHVTSMNGESLAYNPANRLLYTFNGNKLVRIDPETSVTTRVGPAASQVMQGDLGPVTINDIDGLAFDFTRTPPVLFATHRRAAAGLNDLLLVVSTNRGRFVTNAFGPGKDYQVVQNLTFTNGLDQVVVLHDLDGIAQDPVSGFFYGILNDSATEDHLVIVDPMTGGVTDVAEFTVDDVESLSFSLDGALLISTGNNGSPSTNDQLFDVDKNTGVATHGRLIGDGEDYEGLACFTSPTSLAGDQVWLDIDGDGIQGVGEPGVEGVTLTLRRTLDDGVVQGKSSGSAGQFFFLALPSEYVVEATLPAGYVFTALDAPGSTDENDSDIDPLTGRSAAFRQLRNETDLSLDVGVRCLPPVLSIPTDLVLECPASTATNETGAVTAVSPCGCALTVTYSDTFVPGCGLTGVLFREWSVIDACGNATNVTQTLTVVDTAAPVLAGVPNSIIVQCSNVPDLAEVSALDACDGALAVAVSVDTAPGACPGTYTQTRTWTATDACGNTATASQTLQVRDTAPPSFVGLGSNGTRNCAVGLFSNPSAVDNCDPAPVLTSADTVVPGACVFSFTHTRTWTATDHCGNVRTASQVITVVDVTAPVITGVGDSYTRQCSGNLVFSNPTVSDACDPAPSLTFTTTTVPGACPQTYEWVRTWTATDACGNTRTASQTIFVRDTVAPTFRGVGSNATRQCDPRLFSNPVATDNCDPSPVVTQVDTIVPGSCPQNFAKTRTWTATDVCGNSRSASQTITVVDTQAPLLFSITAASAPGNVRCQALLPMLAVEASDNCGAPLVMTQIPAPGTWVGPGVIPVSITVADACGNLVSGSSTFTVTCDGPGLHLLKTVYLGDDGGANCPGLEKVQDEAGAPVTYCYEVRNPGGQPLPNVQLGDASVGLPIQMLGTLPAGGTAHVFHQGEITSDQESDASVVGFPPLSAPLADQDSASVDLIQPAILLRKTLVAGLVGPCPGTNLVTAPNGAPLTACFEVENTGDVPLSDVTITDQALGLEVRYLGTLASGQTVTSSVQTAALGSIVSQAQARGLPPMGPAVSDLDSAAILAFGPGVRLQTSLYVGHDGGVGCVGGAKHLSASPGLPVTYCFLVSNTGDESLTDVQISDPLFGPFPVDFLPLDSGQSSLLIAEEFMGATIATNVPFAVASPPVGPPVEASALYSSGPYATALTLDLRLFPGHGDPVSGCAGALDELAATRGTPVSYCYTVTNTGGTDLASVVINDVTLGLAHPAMEFVSGQLPLPPGASLVFRYPALVQGPLAAEAVAFGVALTPDGEPITSVPAPLDFDEATLNILGEPR